MARNQSDVKRRVLPLLSTKPIRHEIKSDLVAYSDPHDLIAVAAETGDVIAYRVSGHVAFTIKRRTGDEAQVTALNWKKDGSCLAIGWDDGTYGIYSGENGRNLSLSTIRGAAANVANGNWRLDLLPDITGDDDEEDGPVVKCFGWTRHAPQGKRKDDAHTQQHQAEDISTEDWLDEFLEDEPVEDEPDVPSAERLESLSALARAISTLDVTTVLPKLSAIPSHGLRVGPEGNKFTTQAAADGILESVKESLSGVVDTLLVCSTDGCVHLLLDETVKIGTSRMSGPPLLHISNPACSEQIVLCHREDGNFEANSINLPLNVMGGSLLHVVTTNTKRVQNLLAYVVQTVRCIQHDLSTGLQFPTRLLNNMNAELEEKGEEGDIILNLYHLAMTGSFSPTMLEWLVDVVKDTNHKRWDQAVNGMYTNIQNHIFINLLPALERLWIATSTLRGHARFHEDSNRFDVSPKLFTNILDCVTSLRVVAQKLQLFVMNEQAEFKAFSKWLRVMIDIGVAGPGGKIALETEELEVPNLDYPLLLNYISETKMDTRIKPYIESRPGLSGACTKQEFFAHPILSSLTFDHTRDALKRLRDDPTSSRPASAQSDIPDPASLLNIAALTTALAGNVRAAMERITQWQSTMLGTPTTQTFPFPPDALIFASRMSSTGTTEILSFSSLDPTVLSYHTLTSTREPPFSPSQSGPRPKIDSPEHVNHPIDIVAALCASDNDEYEDDAEEDEDEGDYELFAAKFCDECTALILVRRATSSRALLVLVTLPGSTDSEKVEAERAVVIHRFPAPNDDEGGSFAPANLLVGGRKGKKVCVVRTQEDREWRVYDLEAGLRRRKGEKGGWGDRDHDDGGGEDDDGDLEMAED